jgi:hypothetical protein
MDLKKNYYRLYGFEERVDVHSELHDVRTSAIKTLKIKVSNQKRLGNTPHKCHLKK